mmetsp:Transcript_15496/g.18801  ORF Transcript_15496/g.18801 Transcript_15496/m.18801 type:complete len:81 (+) Transcript_15496:123-365(+)
MATNGAEAALSTVDCSSVLKAHQHAALAKQFAAERRYERAAKEHSQCRTYFREAKKNSSERRSRHICGSWTTFLPSQTKS